MYNLMNITLDLHEKMSYKCSGFMFKPLNVNAKILKFTLNNSFFIKFLMVLKYILMIAISAIYRPLA